METRQFDMKQLSGRGRVAADVYFLVRGRSWEYRHLQGSGFGSALLQISLRGTYRYFPWEFAIYSVHISSPLTLKSMDKMDKISLVDIKVGRRGTDTVQPSAPQTL